MACLNRPKALLVISTKIMILDEGGQLVSQSPEGSSRHFNASNVQFGRGNKEVSIARRLFSSFQQQLGVPAEQVAAMSQSPEGSSRHFNQYEFFRIALESECLNRPKALLVISTLSRFACRKRETHVSIARRLFSSFQRVKTMSAPRTTLMSQSPEGSSRHFNFNISNIFTQHTRIVSIARRLFSSFQPAAILRTRAGSRWCLNRPKALLVISTLKKVFDEDLIVEACLNRPKALLVISTI